MQQTGLAVHRRRCPQVTDEMIEACLKGHTINDPRPQIGGDRLVTMGVDQGKDGYISVVDWLFTGIRGPTSMRRLSASCSGSQVRGRRLGLPRRVDAEWQVLACVVDADPNVNDARRFAKKFHGYVWLTRYRRGQTAKEIALSEEETGAPFATVDRTSWLSCTLGRFKTTPPASCCRATSSWSTASTSRTRCGPTRRDDTGNIVRPT